MLLNKCYVMIYHIDTSLIWTLYPTSTVNLILCKLKKILNSFSIFRQKNTSRIHPIFVDIHLRTNTKSLIMKKKFSGILDPDLNFGLNQDPNSSQNLDPDPDYFIQNNTY